MYLYRNSKNLGSQSIPSLMEDMNSRKRQSVYKLMKSRRHFTQSIAEMIQKEFRENAKQAKPSKHEKNVKFTLRTAKSRQPHLQRKLHAQRSFTYKKPR